MADQQVLIIGGGVLKPKAACRLKRLRPDLRQLRRQGFDNCAGLQGGVASLKKSGLLNLG